MSVVKTFFKLLNLNKKNADECLKIFLYNGFDNMRIIYNINNNDLSLMNINKQHSKKILNMVKQLKKDDTYTFIFVMCNFNIENGNDYYEKLVDHGYTTFKKIKELNQDILYNTLSIEKFGHIKLILGIIPKMK